MDNVPTSVIKCPQCAADNDIPVDEKFLECAFCGSAIYVDKSKVVNHYIVTSNFGEKEAEGNLRRWMAGNFQVKDLDKLAKISAVKFYYFPVWYFKSVTAAGDKLYIQPAASTAISEIKKITIPAGNLKLYKKGEVDETSITPPDVFFDSAQNWLKESGVELTTVTESSLIHIPFFQFTYDYAGKQYTALVEASSGMVYANLWPAKSEIPFRLLFILSIIGFLLVSVVVIALSGNSSNITRIEGVKLFLYGLIAVPLLIIAYFIAKKV
jgi:hypothetical protein